MLDAEFTMGDWDKPHELKTETVEDGISFISCTCGWTAKCATFLARGLGDAHLDRAFSRP